MKESTDLKACDELAIALDTGKIDMVIGFKLAKLPIDRQRELLPQALKCCEFLQELTKESENVNS